MDKSSILIYYDGKCEVDGFPTLSIIAGVPTGK
jgi:hypothetical protein